MATLGVSRTPQRAVELGYAEITANATSTTTYANVADDSGDVAGLAVTVTVGARPILVKFECQRLQNDTATTASVVSIMEGDTELTNARFDQHATVSEGVPVHREVRLAPSAGSHTYKITLTTVAAATATIQAASMTPAFIQVVEC